MNICVPVRKIIKIVSMQRIPKHERRSSLQECPYSTAGSRRRCRWNPWIILFFLLSVAIYLYLHRAYNLPAMNGQVFINELLYDAPPQDKVESTHHVTYKKKTSASPIRNPSTANTIDIVEGSTKTKTTVDFYKIDYDVYKSLLVRPSKSPRQVLPICFRKRPYPKFQIRLESVNLSQENVYPQVVKGGSYHPPDCKARFKVGIIVPYRDRDRNLGTFLYNIHPFLMRQKLDYQIFVIEQEGTGLFNKGRLYNAGFSEMLKFNFFHCVVFHDVDLLPLHENIVYNCPTLPRHMCARVNDTEMKKIEPLYKFQSLFGGVVSMTREQFERANGFSNLYFGWGGEDNDMFWRLRAAGYPIVRYNSTVGVYLVLPHKREAANPFRTRPVPDGAYVFHARLKEMSASRRDPIGPKPAGSAGLSERVTAGPEHKGLRKEHGHHLLSRAVDRYKIDGLSNSEYYVVSTKFRPLCTHIVVDINPRGDNITELNIKWDTKGVY